MRVNLARKPIVKLDSINIEYVNDHMYLGVILDEKLNFREQLLKVGRKATAAFYKILPLGTAN